MFTAKQKHYMYEVLKLNIVVTRVICSKCKKRLVKIDKTIGEIESAFKSRIYSWESLTNIIDLLEERYNITWKKDLAKINKYKKIIRENRFVSPAQQVDTPEPMTLVSMIRDL